MGLGGDPRDEPGEPRQAVESESDRKAETEVSGVKEREAGGIKKKIARSRVLGTFRPRRGAPARGEGGAEAPVHLCGGRGPEDKAWAVPGVAAPGNLLQAPREVREPGPREDTPTPTREPLLEHRGRK